MGLVLDGEGFPKAHEVFTGNTKDETSMARMLASLDCRTKGAVGWPRQPTVIMDRGIATDENLELLRQRGQHYIVTTPQSERQELFPKIDSARYVPVKVNAKGKVVVCGQLRRQGELYVLCHSAARASKDRAIRQRFEQRLEEDAEKLKTRVARPAEAAGEDQPGNRASIGPLSARSACCSCTLAGPSGSNGPARMRRSNSPRSLTGPICCAPIAPT